MNRKFGFRRRASGRRRAAALLARIPPRSRDRVRWCRRQAATRGLSTGALRPQRESRLDRSFGQASDDRPRGDSRIHGRDDDGLSSQRCTCTRHTGPGDESRQSSCPATAPTGSKNFGPESKVLGARLATVTHAGPDHRIRDPPPPQDDQLHAGHDDFPDPVLSRRSVLGWTAG